MFWKYFLTWFIGFVMGGIVVQELYKKYKDDHNHSGIQTVPPSKSPAPKALPRQH